MRTIPDSNIFLDVFQHDKNWFEWSMRKLRECRDTDLIVVNAITFSETAGHFLSFRDIQTALSVAETELEELPWEAAYLAGHVHRKYRRSGGLRERVLPDFLIGAHAAVKSYRILTRDAARYRTYFPDVDIIAPDTHP